MDIDQIDNDNDDKQSKHNEQGDFEDHDDEDKFLNDLELNDRIKHIVDKVKSLDMNQIGDAYKKKDTRLIIDKIEMQNFKSYQGNVTIGPLYHKFNAIVGPNGSGKSNLMESLLFVFGKRAKSMRLKKLTDLIHKSTNFPDIKYARVSVYFKEIRDKEDGSYEEVSKDLIITREVNKASGSSKYYLDKHEITHDGLCNRLEEYGIDLKHNRFLILQGEVEQISMLANKAKPGAKEGGLLEFLEDIIGTNRYVTMINHLSKDTEDILDIKLAKEKRVKLCKGDVNKMEESKNVCIEYFKEEKSLFYLLYLEGKISTLEIQSELKVSEEKLKAREEKKKLKVKEMEELKSKNDKILQELNEKKLEQKKLEKLKTKEEGKLNSLEDEDRIKRAELDNLEKAIKKEENSKKIIMKNYDELNENFQNAKNQLPSINEELSRIAALLNKDEELLKKQEKEAYEKTSSLQKEKQEIEKALSPYLNEIQVAEFEISQKEKLLNMDSIYIQLKDSLSQNEDKYKEVTQELNGYEKRLKEIEGEKQVYKEQISKLDNELKDVYKKLDDNDRVTNELLAKLNENYKEIQKGEQKSNLIVSLMNAKKSGELKGIRGRLGDLGTIDQKYDIAISTAAFNQLESILVETVEDAERCIAFLKAKKLGRANFIILTEMERYKAEMNKPFQSPEQTERLFDKIKTQSEYAPAFYQALKNTLVARDLEVANRAAYGKVRYRVVTLSGELVEISGAMSGGGRPKQGSMSNQKIKDEQEVAKICDGLKLQIDQRRLETQSLQDKKKDLEKEINSLNLTLSPLLINISNIEKAISYHQKIQLDLDKEINHLKMDLKKAEDENKKLSSIRDQIEQNRIKITSLKDKSKDLSNKLNKIVEQIGKIGGDKLKELQEKVRFNKEKNNELNEKKTNFEQIITQAPKEISKIKDSIEVKNSNITSLKSEIEIKQRELQELDKRAEAILLEIDRLKNEVIKVEQEFKQLASENSSFKESLKRINDEKIQIEADIAQQSAEMNKQKQKLKNAKESMEEINKRYGKFVREFGFIDQLIKDINRLNNIEEEENKITSEYDSRKKKNSVFNHLLNEEIFKNKFSEEDEAMLLEHKVEINRTVSYKKLEIEKLKPNMEIIKEYRERLLDLRNKEEDLSQCIEQLTTVQTTFEDIKKKRNREFMEGFTLINSKLKEMYRLITNGGDAELELVDSMDPFTEGISFSVRPNKKSWKQIINLSGGEKTLSSLSLIFALHHFKPSPLYVMDEIDAALDFKNVSIIASYIKERTNDSQFMIISLRSHMFELANRLIGIYKTYDVTKTIIYDNDIPVEVQKDESKRKNESYSKSMRALTSVNKERKSK